MADYPSDREVDIVLHDGSTVHVRPVRPDDRGPIRQFLAGVSPEAIGFRFFGAADLNWAADWSIDVDYDRTYGLVALSGSPAQAIAHAAYVGMEDDRAEVAFLVADAWQGRGISTILLAHLADFAHSHGVSTFIAEVMPANRRMIEVFRRAASRSRCARRAMPSRSSFRPRSPPRPWRAFRSVTGSLPSRRCVACSSPAASP